MFHKEKEPYGAFSQWFRDFDKQKKTQFTCPETGINFNCAEQRMMYEKACLFGAHSIAHQILNVFHPLEQKKLGREIENFDQKLWEENNQDIVYQGNYLKFTQNKTLFELLMSTTGALLVEASPRDTIRGIGLSANDPRSKIQSQWRGSNKLGNILTQLRKDLS